MRSWYGVNIDNKKIEIFEKTEHDNIGNNAEGKPEFFICWVFYFDCCKIIDKNKGKKYEYVWGNCSDIKKTTGN